MAKPNYSLCKPKHATNWHVRFVWEGKTFRPSTGTSIRAEAERIAESIRLKAIVAYEVGKANPMQGAHDDKVVMLNQVEELFARYMSMPKSPRSAPKYLECFRKLRVLHQIETLLELTRFLESHTLRAENMTRAAIREREHSIRPKPLSAGGYKSFMRNAAGVFSKGALQYYSRNIDVLENPFAELDLRANFEAFRPPPGGLEFVGTLQRNASAELRTTPPVHLLFLLCLGCGLRAQEATHVQWSDLGEKHLYVRSDSIHLTKSGHSRYVPISGKLRDLLLSYKLSSAVESDFVIATKKAVLKRKKLPERCGHVQRQLGIWLRGQGIKEPITSHPVHYLRKLFGAMIVTRHANGYALAKDYLGHSSVVTTETIYAGLLERPAPDIF